MQEFRAIALVAIVLSFGFGMTSLVEAAGDLRTEQIVYHDVRVVL